MRWTWLTGEGYNPGMRETTQASRKEECLYVLNTPSLSRTLSLANTCFPS